jgi:predicted aldo/keto reductase-like oxidoreductase
MEKIRLGKTDIFVTPVGMGTLTMGFSQRGLPVSEGAAVIEYAVKSGIGFLDTAQYYDTYRYLRPALDALRDDPDADMPVICSKTLETGYEGTVDAVEECLEELDLDSVDIFLMHEVRGTSDFEERSGAWRALQDMKKKGLVRAVGISTHHVDACALMAEHPECDAVFALLNMTGLGIRDGDGPGTRENMEKAVRACSDAGTGVFTMKAFGGGNLIEDYRKCLDYASSVPGNSAVMIGMASREEVDRAVEYFEGRLSPDYRPDISNKRLMVDQSDCEGCGTCKARCVSGAIHWNENGLAEIDPAKCVRCGYCAPVCPVRAIIFL